MTQVLRYGERSNGTHRGITLDGPWPEVVRYSASAPQHVFREPKPPKVRERYSSGSVLGPDDIRQIVQALESLDWVIWVKERMRSERGNNGTVQPEPPETPREKYAKTRKEAQQLRREARRLSPADRDFQEHYERAEQADGRYRQSREAIASRIMDYAMRNGCSWDEAVAKTGEQPPLPLLAGVC